MSIFGVGSTASNALARLGVGNAQPQNPQLGMAPSAYDQAALPAAYMAQPSGGGFGSILKKVLVGGVAGAGAGAGYGLLAGMVSFMPHVTVPMGALIGAAAGAALGLVKGIRDNMKSKKLGLQQQALIQSQLPSNVANPNAAKLRTLRYGAKGREVSFTQQRLKRLGVYHGKITGKFDKQTLAAIRRYEVMKGAMPTGLCSPALRSALTQDTRAARQFGL